VRPGICLLAAAILLAIAAPIGAAAQTDQGVTKTPSPPAGADRSIYSQLVGLYRAGEIDRAVDGLARSLAPTDAQNPAQTGLDAWIEQASLAARSGTEPGRQNARRDLEAMMLLATETLMKVRASRTSAIDVPEFYWVPVEKLQERLKKIDPATPFLRAWYLLWQSFRQRHITDLWRGWKETEGPLLVRRRNDAWGGWLEYSWDAEDAFPDDGLVRLALGARRELQWWTSDVNPHRNLSEPVRVDREFGRDFTQEALEAAASHLRRSVALNPTEGEAVLRLSRVLIQLDRLDEAERVLMARVWSADEAAFEYLARLFEGDIKERRKDFGGASAAYDRAIGLVPYSQSARMAKAHALEMLGRQADAAELAASILKAPTGVDPWWLYVNGESWRLDLYMKNARAQVMK
jgi:tetratricopeptide (TPR) repeat protein